VDDGGDGEAPGDEKPSDGLVTRFGPGFTFVVALKNGRADSSSEVAVSTSLNSDDKKEGSPLVSINGRAGLPERISEERWVLRIAGREALELSGIVGGRTIRVRGRFNFRSGSRGSRGSAGEPVADRDFRLRGLGVDEALSISLALSKAPQAFLSSGVNSGVCCLCSRGMGAELRKISRAP
jgi:hypothetical protein